MVRKDTYTDNPTIDWILDHCKILHLGLATEDLPYVVPVHYGYDESTDGHYTIYVHGTDDGKKASLLNSLDRISFETDSGHNGVTYTPPATSAFGPAYYSAMGDGKVTALSDPSEKLHALRTLIKHYVRDIPVAIHKQDVAHVAVWKISVDNITGRVHHPTTEWQTALGIQEKISKGYHYNAAGDLFKKDDESTEDGGIDTSASASIKKN